MTRNALSNRQIARAAAVVVVGFLASGVLGLLRTVFFSVTFGGGVELDAFYAAQRVPELLYVLVAGGALSSSFIPVFSRYWAKDDADGAWQLASAVITLASLIAGILAVILILIAPWFVPNVLVPGASPEEALITTQMSQIMLVTVVIFTASGLLMGILNARQSFLLPSIALSMNNLGQIFGALVLVNLMPQFGLPRIYGLAIGAVMGAFLHLIVQIPGLKPVGARLRFLPDWRVKGARDVLLLMLPRVLGLAVVQLNFLVNVILTSEMLPGSRTALTTAWTLMFFVLGVIAQSIGTAVFPSLSALASSGDMEGFKDRLSSAMRGVLFLGFPATIGLITLGGMVIKLMFEHGDWTAENTQATAWALAFFAVGVAGHGLLEMLARSFFALSDTWTPVLVGIASMGANIALSLLLIRAIGDPQSLAVGPFAGLALANSLTTLAEAALLWVLLHRRIGNIRDGHILRGGGAALLAALAMGAVILLIGNLLQSLPSWLALGITLTAGGLTFFGLAALLGLEEARVVPMRLLRRARG
ncbi:MAG: murein biosynthesis integral membrane protein MurJ [Anaerolineae bacterium]|nr:murein biosynthesis integral membrane protein MurJ [Anaerolineae bacterium]